jgi:hypothetical protein
MDAPEYAGPCTKSQIAAAVRGEILDATRKPGGGMAAKADLGNAVPVRSTEVLCDYRKEGKSPIPN